MSSPFAPRAQGNRPDAFTTNTSSETSCSGVSRLEVWRPGQSHPKMLDRQLLLNELYADHFFYDGHTYQTSKHDSSGTTRGTTGTRNFDTKSHLPSQQPFSFARKLPLTKEGQQVRAFVDKERCASLESQEALRKGLTC